MQNGENVLGVMLGNGWYAGREHAFGDKKLIFRLVFTDGNGKTAEILSDDSVQWKTGFVTEYHFTNRQTQDFTGYDETWLLPGGSTDGFEKVNITDIPEKKRHCCLRCFLPPASSFSPVAAKRPIKRTMR